MGLPYTHVLVSVLHGPVTMLFTLSLNAWFAPNRTSVLAVGAAADEDMVVVEIFN